MINYSQDPAGGSQGKALAALAEELRIVAKKVDRLLFLFVGLSGMSNINMLRSVTEKGEK